MSWILLLIAGLLEVAWAAGLKSSEGFTRFWPSAFTVATALGSFILLAMAMRHALEVGVKRFDEKTRTVKVSRKEKACMSQSTLPSRSNS